MARGHLSFLPSWKRVLGGLLLAMVTVACAVASFGLWNKHANGQVVSGTVLAIAHAYEDKKAQRYWAYSVKSAADRMTYNVIGDEDDRRNVGDKIDFTMTVGDRDAQFGDARIENKNLSIGFAIFAVVCAAFLPMVWRPSGGWRLPFR